MAYIDAENVLMDTDSISATTNGNIVDLGSKGPFISPLEVDVKLTKKLTNGSISSVALYSSSMVAFNNPQKEIEVTIGPSVPQTSKPCTLAQFQAPIKPSNRYVRLTANASTPVGGAIHASMQQAIKVDM